MGQIINKEIIEVMGVITSVSISIVGDGQLGERWLNFEPHINSWSKARETNLLKSIFTDPEEIKFWSNIFEKFYLKEFRYLGYRMGLHLLN